MVFKKRALGSSANISYDSCPKPSLLIQQHVYTQRNEKKKKKKPYTTGHFGTIHSYNGTPVLAYRYFHTHFDLHQSKHVFTYELIHNGFWPL